ncbi:hypothetical protein Bca4012_068381 [Brassica carinata]
MESGGLTKRTPEGEAPELRRRWRQRCGGGGAGGGGGAKRIGTWRRNAKRKVDD